MSNRSWWGWGNSDEGLSKAARNQVTQMLIASFGADSMNRQDPTEIGEIHLRKPQVELASSITIPSRNDPISRITHSYGKSYKDLIRGFRGQYENPPDIVSYPRNENEIVQLLDWAESCEVAVIPFGGGSSVTGGVEPSTEGRFKRTLVIDMSSMNKVLEIDLESRSAKIQAGIFGPKLEDELRPNGLTLRHFPQSFEFSTLGGWIATRAGGHYATLYTHIDDFVEAIDLITPAGRLSTLRFPASGAGPQPERLILGSEGAFGIITQAWMRLQDRPQFKSVESASFSRFEDAISALKQLSQSGLNPSNLRLLDPIEAAISIGDSSGDTIVLVGFESKDLPTQGLMSQATEILASHTGKFQKPTSASSTSANLWKQSFLKAPYLRDHLISLGIMVETFETACTWSNFDNLRSKVTIEVKKALDAICGGGYVSMRITHVYPDGPAPYFTVIAPAKTNSEIAQWEEIKSVASEAILASCGTITHHHSVGRDHQSYYLRQIPTLFEQSLRAMKDRLDPKGIMNPGVLIPDHSLAI
ncbi:FAD-binding oxidoreductase [Acidithrix sp. C25]|uniref:FAD-binding oxidoreductase n=1 Tax=Acidithrix sp. C25 TaxID=1671482 RepID=UPI00191BC15B|nr:FAD-binding oxidoreductase [Acidithrix sp. C25]CAG4915075.1 unnamed protein product [Acidithrix sp. C25]